jgi:hypothetical protein
MDPSRTTPLAALVALLVPLSLARPAAAAEPEFREFTKGMCGDCELPAGYGDVLSLAGGVQVKGRIIAENDSYYVVERFGEVRAVGKRTVSKTTFAAGSKPTGLNRGDHILLDNGHVIVGKIVAEKDKPGLFKVESRLGGGATITVFKHVVASVHKEGKRFEFEKPPLYNYKVGDEYRSHSP